MRFSISLTEFQYITSRTGRRTLRFSLLWRVEDTATGKVYGDKSYGNIAKLDPDGTLIWTPHMHRKKGFLSRLHEVTPDLYNEVYQALDRSPHVRFLRDPLWTPQRMISEESL
jgi:hypothetical protein